MPYLCAVADCGNSTNKNNRESENHISFHHFPPPETQQCRAWIVRCRRADENLDPKKSRICSEHFTNDDFERDLKGELLGMPPKKKLKPDVVPHVFKTRSNYLPSESAIARDHRATKRNRRAIVQELMQADQSDSEDVIMDSLKDETKDESSQTDQCKCDSCEVHENTITRLRQQVQRLNTRISNKNKLIQQLKSNLANSEQITKKKTNKWTTENIVKAVSLRTVSLKDYETVRKRWKLNIPAPRTIRSHVQNFKCTPGIIHEVLEAMKIKCEDMDLRARLCGLVFDEMSLDSRLVHDKFEDKLYYNSKAQVLMVRGLCNNWKQPLYFDFDTPMTKEILYNIIKQLEEIGLHVHCVTSDFGAENLALWKAVGIGEEDISFSNPYDDGRKIYVFADVPHMLKLIRNHLIDDGVCLSDGTVLNNVVLDKLIEFNGNEKKLCPHLNPKLVQLTKAERMRVRPAAQLLSNHVSKLAEIVYPESPSIAYFFKTLNDGFDVLNSKIPVDEKEKIKSGYGMSLEEQNQALNNLQDLMKSMRFFTKGKNTKQEKVPKKALLPCQKGFILSISSFMALREDLKQQYNVHYLLGIRTNQDILESYFSLVRAFGGSNSTPNPLEFRYRMRLLILGSKPRLPKGTNCEIQDMNYIATEIPVAHQWAPMTS